MPYKDKEKKREQQKKYYESNKETLKLQVNKEQKKLANKKYRDANKDRLREQKKLANKKYRDTNKAKLNEQKKLANKKYRDINKDKINEQNKQYYRNRRLTDNLFKLKGNIRTLIYNSIRNNGYTKSNKTEQILGCTFEEFKQHLEGLFEPWMSWDNYGNPKDGLIEPNKTWDIDHVIPVSNGLIEQELIQLNHYSNLQPLCSHYNRNIKRAN